MSKQRPRAESNAIDPHAISLKVLRLSRPSLASQTPLTATQFGKGLDIDPKASLAYPSGPGTSFPLSPVLTLPKSFGLAYVGQRFECTLCVNNESSLDGGKSVNHVKITADLQTPTAQTGIPLELSSLSPSSEDGYRMTAASRTLQLNLARELQEAGQHVLIVTVTYTEVLGDQSKTRTFRKLYQFVAQQLISIRSKVTERQKSNTLRQWVIEAQIENMGEDSVMLPSVVLKPDDSVDVTNVTSEEASATSLKAQDIQQVMFLVKQKHAEQVSRPRLGQIHVQWSAALGEKGTVKTGWLLSKT